MVFWVSVSVLQVAWSNNEHFQGVEDLAFGKHGLTMVGLQVEIFNILNHG